jgi:hypothetical protein
VVTEVPLKFVMLDGVLVNVPELPELSKEKPIELPAPIS